MSIKTLPTGDYKSARGQLVLTLLSGTLAGHSFAMGDTETKRTISAEYDERYTNEFAVQTLAYKEVSKVTAELELTLYQWGRVAKMLAHMSDVETADEAAAADQTFTLQNAKGDEVIVLPARRVTNVIVSDGDGEIYVEGEHYRVSTGDGSRSYVSLFGKPAGAGVDVQVDFDRLASKGERYAFGSQTEVLAQVTFIENVKPASGRSPETHVYWRVGLKVDGDYQLIGSENTPRSGTIKGTIYPDSTKPAGYELGQIEDGIVAV